LRKYLIVAESGADLTKKMIEDNDIRVVQMHVEMDGVNHHDHDVDLDDLVGYFKRTGKIPKTAGANPQQYTEVFDRIKKEDPDAVVLHICYSAQLSVGWQSSFIADDGVLDVRHIDSKNVTMGQGIVVLKAIEMIAENPAIEPDELVARIEELVERVRFSFIPGDIAYLKAGGRVSNAQYMGARLLRVKPLIEVIDGLMPSTKKYKGKKHAIMLHALSEYLDQHDIEKDKMYFGYVYSLEDDLKTEMEALVHQAGIPDIEWVKAGAVITSHAGPGGIGILGIEKAGSPT
jgi:DegV family protein with EDD domain